MDLFPTLVDVAGLSVPDPGPGKDRAGRDGVSLAPSCGGRAGWAGPSCSGTTPHHQHYQQGGTMPYGSVRSGDFKLIEFFNDMRVELYDLKADIGEEHDLAKTRPQLARELRDGCTPGGGRSGRRCRSPTRSTTPPAGYTPVQEIGRGRTIATSASAVAPRMGALRTDLPYPAGGVVLRVGLRHLRPDLRRQACSGPAAPGRAGGGSWLSRAPRQCRPLRSYSSTRMSLKNSISLKSPDRTDP